jgi:nucleotide-binding universal stress UspA family protein
MPFKVILIYIEDSPSFDACIETAARLAMQNHSHVIGTMMKDGAMTDGERLASPMLSDRFESRAQDLKLASYEIRRIEEDAAIGISKLGKCSDLVIVGRQGAEPDTQRANFLEYVILNCGSPVLVLPPITRPTDTWDSVLVAWDSGMPAVRALRLSLPILRRAQRVDLVNFQSPIESKDIHDESMSDVVQYLHWHGIKANPVYRSSDGNIGKALQGVANELSDKLIVMGCVAHPHYSTLRLGGATRSILESTPVPVLMSR